MTTVKHTPDTGATRDLMRKLGDDVSACMLRTLSLAEDRQRLPIGISAGATCIGIIAGILNSMEGAENPFPDPDCVLLAALLVGRSGIGGDDPIGDAYRDLKILQDAAASKATQSGDSHE